MLYQTNPAASFSAIAEVLRDIGVYDRALEIMPEYLDTDKPRNNALLDSITPQPLGQLTYDKREKLGKAIQKEISRTGSEELYERWVLFVHAVAGAEYMKLNWHNDMKYDDWKKSMISAFSSRFGNDAEAVFYAVSLTSYVSGNAWYALTLRFTKEKPEICLRAAHYTPNPHTRMMLGLFALDGMTPPEQKKGLAKLFSGNQEKAVEEALSLIGEAAGKAAVNTMVQDEYLLTALAEASLFSEEYRKLFEKHLGVWRASVGTTALNLPINVERIFDILDELPLSQDTPNYISLLGRTVLTGNGLKGYVRNGELLKQREKHLKRMAERFPAQYRAQMQQEDNPSVIVLMEKVLISVTGEAPEISAQELTKARCLALINQLNTDPEIADFLYGRTDIQPLLAIAPKLNKYQNSWSMGRIDYVGAFGMDEFAGRVITYMALVTKEFSNYVLFNIPGMKSRHNYDNKDPKPLIAVMHKNGLPMEYLLNAVAQYSASFYGSNETESKDHAFLALKAYADEIAAANVKELTADARCLYVQVLGDAKKYDDQLIALTDDGSKAVRALLCDYLPHDEALIRSLLAAKKGAKREMAAVLLEKHFPESLRPDVEAAFAAEKSNSVKKRFADLLGAALPEEAKAELTGDIVTELTKGNKAKKVAWLYENPFKPVRKTDGADAEDAYLQALLLCYANANPLGRSAVADNLAAGLHTDDLERFAAEVFARWLNAGAQAKTKWVLYMTAVHGGLSMVEVLQRYIKDWAEHSRGAIAAEAVSALAMNGSSSALIAVDNMARKFKNKQVRSAAGATLEHAAEELHLTREELADQIVPDLGFDEQLCRTFDFGPRQFKVYLTPALELEIFEGEKRLKNLPKPGAKDDPEISAVAVKDFKEMKKQMKAAIQSQRQRLEYVLLCDRKWTADGWRDLFIRKAVMHSFAIGLIWGVYEKNTLVQSFRYMEDGSFNTPDEEEYTIPEGADIGLVHPMELDEETLAAWREQLSDYEIMQPFPQLDRPVYRLTETEKKQKALLRFEDKELSDVMLLGRMTKLGWDKGTPQDAGMFYEFRRTDIIRQEKQPDGTTRKVGYCTELRFSGMYAGGFDYTNPEDVTIGKVEFCAPGNASSWVNENPKALPLGEVSERYMSEIIAQLTGALTAAEKEDAT